MLQAISRCPGAIIISEVFCVHCSKHDFIGYFYDAVYVCSVLRSVKVRLLKLNDYHK